jgi:hypothetical protein
MVLENLGLKTLSVASAHRQSRTARKRGLASASPEGLVSNHFRTDCYEIHIMLYKYWDETTQHTVHFALLAVRLFHELHS